MGAWGSGSFENDSAYDCLPDLLASADDKGLSKAFHLVLQSSGYIDVDDCAAVVAASEVVAAWNGYPCEDLPEDVYDWLRTKPIINTREMKKLALAAVSKVRDSEQSELKGLWTEAGPEAGEWMQTVDDLVSRLQLPKKTLRLGIKKKKQQDHFRVYDPVFSQDLRKSVSICENGPSRDGAITQIIVSFYDDNGQERGGSGIFSAFGIDLPIGTKWLNNHELLIELPSGIKVYGRQEYQTQYYDTVIKISYVS